MLQITQRDVEILIFVVLAVMVLKSVSRRREAIRFLIRQMVGVCLIAACIWVGALMLGQTQSNANGITLLSLIVLIAALPKRRRYLRVSERRKAIARFELETGKKYNPRKHDLDHEIPFSRGGNNSADNLRVKGRRENRKKGARSTWWDVFAK